MPYAGGSTGGTKRRSRSLRVDQMCAELGCIQIRWRMFSLPRFISLLFRSFLRPRHPSLQAAYIYEGMVANDVPRAEIELDQQLVFFNELFGWARIAFVALADRPPPHALYGPSPEGTSSVQFLIPCPR